MRFLANLNCMQKLFWRSYYLKQVSDPKSYFLFLIELFPVLYPSDEHKENKILVKCQVLMYANPDGA